MTTTTTYTITAAPKFSDFFETDCRICGHAELAKPVWLRSSDGVTFPAGATCAAKAIYGNDYAQTKSRVRKTAEAVQHEADRAEALRQERIEWFTQALADFNADRQGTPALQSARQSFHANRTAGRIRPEVTFPQYLATVAETGAVEV